MTPVGSQLDLDHYLERIAYRGALLPTADVLAALHLAHVRHIPFENLDVLLGRGIRLDMDSVFAKLVTAQRGGYCFEQNLLFAAVLEQIGFRVRRLAARVTYRTQRVLPRTHMLLQVEADDTIWLADVGFGAAGPLLPVAFHQGQPQTQHLWRYRLVELGGLWSLQIGMDDWADLYRFGLDEQTAADYEMANYYVSTHPDSRFLHGLIAHRLAPERRLILIGSELTEDRGARVDTRRVDDPAVLRTLLIDDIGLPAAEVAEFIDTLVRERA
ncbi:arylamine N-acetyltransferase [Immundisolibacter sp.]|uniref:arylamine N-acetyltransferase family protein n=1 Tax=Immundisolibacter sp. TaxID=1934948 RepID=UPI003565DB54